jgi:FixJ family two-component response regulator
MSFCSDFSAASDLSPLQAPPTVFVIDTDPAVRASLAQLMGSMGLRSKTFASAEEFLSTPRPPPGPGCLICEVMLPGLSGLELQAALAGEGNIPVIFLTSHANVSITVRAMKAGAVEFLTKPFSEEVLVDALCSAVERSREAVRQELELSELRKRHATLSDREREVMELVVSGLLNKQVGSRLCITEMTVKAHRGKVMRKMSAESLAALVRMAASLGVSWPASGIRYRRSGLEKSRMAAEPIGLASAIS